MTQREGPGGLMMTHDEAVLLVAAYALDALDAAERAPFEGHVASCALCQREFAELQRVTVGLGLSGGAVEPPPDLKARVLARAVAERQATPKAAPQQPLSSATVVQLPLGPTRSAANPPAPRSPSWLALAASVVLAIGLGTYAMSLRSRLSDADRMIGEYSARLETVRDQLASERLRATRLANTINVLGAPDIVKVTLRGQADAPAAVGRAYISASRGMIFETEQLPVLPAGKVYQLWVIPGEKGKLPVSAGIFIVAPNGSFSLMRPLPEGVTAPQIVAVTVEDGPNGVVQSKNAPVLAGQAGQ
jgi:anti-sigma-K factor RskA